MRDLKINQKKLETAGSRFNNFGVSLAFVLSIGIGFSTTANSALLQACNSLTYTKVAAGLQFSIVKDVPLTCSWYRSSGYYGGSTEICFGDVSTCIIQTPTTAISVTVSCSDSTGSCASGISIPLAKPTCTLTAVASSVELGNSSTLTANCLPTSTTYVWTGGTCANNKTLSCTVTPSSSTTYTVKGYNSSGYGDVANATVIVVPATSSNATTVVEFYNTVLDNYFITADAGEAAAIDSGSAGPGWTRTENSFKSGGKPVCRFYGSQSPGPNSHFYTADAGECAYLKQLQVITPDTTQRWNFESFDFLTTVPTNGSCPANTIPVFRAYNNGSTRGVDSNHRITSNQAAIQEVVTRGWNNEGIVMCAPQ